MQGFRPTTWFLFYFFFAFMWKGLVDMSNQTQQTPWELNLSIAGFLFFFCKNSKINILEILSRLIMLSLPLLDLNYSYDLFDEPVTRILIKSLIRLNSSISLKIIY